MSIRILIADDNPVFRTTLRHLLETTDDHWEVIETGDGAEAVSKSLETRPDVIVLDLAMPVKDGLSATRELSQALPGTPILLYTMHASPVVQLEAQKAGARKTLSKTDSIAIVPAIQQLLASPQPPVSDTAILPPLPPLPATGPIPSANASAAPVPDPAIADPPAPAREIGPKNAA